MVARLTRSAPASSRPALPMPAEVEADRLRHLAAVRAMFESLDVFVFTLGLTEGWMHRRGRRDASGSPGVVGGTFDPETYAFVNARRG